MDDNPDIRSHVRHVLEPAFRVVEAVDGLDGLEAALEVLPDVVVADVMMPRLDGLGLSRALRHDARTCGVPVILLTARAEARDEIGGLGAGADDYVTKPFDAQVLRARVHSLLASRQRLRELVRAELRSQGTRPIDAEGSPAPASERQPTSRAPGSSVVDPQDARPADAEISTGLRPYTEGPLAPPARQRSVLEERVRTLIQKNLCEEGLSVELLARELAMSRSQLFRRLKEEAGTTPSDLIRGIRLQKAAELLQRRAGNVSEVAFAVGFNSLAHFSRSFRAHFRVAPSDYARGGTSAEISVVVAGDGRLAGT